MQPGAAAMAACASSTEMGVSVSIHTLSEWERSDDTLTQVAEHRTSECMILRVSLNIFISSFV